MFLSPAKARYKLAGTFGHIVVYGSHVGVAGTWIVVRGSPRGPSPLAGVATDETNLYCEWSSV